MTGFNPTSFVVAAVVIALLTVVLLSVFRSRLPDRVRVVLEKGLGVGYPIVVGLGFAMLSMRAYSQSDDSSAVGFAVGGVVMVLLAARSAKRGVWKR